MVFNKLLNCLQSIDNQLVEFSFTFNCCANVLISLQDLAVNSSPASWSLGIQTQILKCNLHLKNCAWSLLCLWSHTITCLILPFLSFFDNFVKNTHTCQLMKIKTCSGQRRTTWGENFNISSLPYHSIFSLRNSPEWKQISYRNFYWKTLLA